MTNKERKPIPPSTCDYLIRMHLNSIQDISRYMSGGCGNGPLNGPQGVCIALINLRKHIDRVLEEYSV